MSKYNIGWRDSMRLKHGCTWRSTSPTLADYPQVKTYLIRLLFVLAIWGWAMDQDYAASLVSGAASAEMRAELAEQQMLACLNGTARWISEDKKTLVACDAWSTKL